MEEELVVRRLTLVQTRRQDELQAFEAAKSKARETYESNVKSCARKEKETYERYLREREALRNPSSASAAASVSSSSSSFSSSATSSGSSPPQAAALPSSYTLAALPSTAATLSFAAEPAQGNTNHGEASTLPIL